MSLSAFQFTLPELLSLIGLTQCVYLLVYMVFRSGRLSRGMLPAIYFLVLGLAFLFDAGQRHWGPLIPVYEHLQWLFWFVGPPLSTLLVVQIARITQVPQLENYAILLLIPAAYFGSLLMSGVLGECEAFSNCEMADQWLMIAGLVVGAFSLLTIWFKRDLLDKMSAHKGGEERFWLIMALIFLNTAFLTAMAFAAYQIISFEQATLIRTILGISFVYTASTSLFRLYPQAVRIRPKEREETESLNDAELELALKLEDLLSLEKVYQEPSYGRADLARELNVNESTLSRIVGVHFDKNVPQLLNEHRVADAQRLLKETDASIGTVAEEAGFNSAATFNRVFKELTGFSPSDFRNKYGLKIT